MTTVVVCATGPGLVVAAECGTPESCAELVGRLAGAMSPDRLAASTWTAGPALPGRVITARARAVLPP